MPTEYFDPHKQVRHTKLNRLFTRYSQRLLFLWERYVAKRNIWGIIPWISISWGRVEHNNWGDDINMFFLRKMAKDCLLPQKAFSYPSGESLFYQVMPYPKISCIGSTLHLIDDRDTIIWGSGLLKENMLPPVKLKNVMAVRGPLTRNALISHGIECPEVYGDPALLLPYFYTPCKKKKKYKIGIIPHYVDYFKNEAQQYAHMQDCLIIKIFNYRNWKDVIDQICSCQFIISSSLHGLIAAEAYNIPNQWVEFKEPLVNDTSRRFKFHDFFLSMGLDRDNPYTITLDTTLKELLNLKGEYTKPKGLSLSPLVEACPFRIKEKYRKKIV